MESCCSRFTAAEGGARLAAAASARNTLAVEYASFVATRLVHEDAYKIRGPLFEGRQRSVYVTRASRVKVVAYELNILTDLAVTQALTYEDVFNWQAEIKEKEVLVCTSPVLKKILEDKLLLMPTINVLILDSCHLVSKDESLQFIMKHYKECEEDKRPRILALTYPLFASTKKDSETTNSNKTDNSDTEKLPEMVEIEETTNKETDLKNNETTDTKTETVESKIETTDSKTESDEGIETTDEKERKRVVEEIGAYENLDDFEMYEKLEWKIEELEKDLCCQMDLAEDIDGGKRFSSTVIKPKELIIEYKSVEPVDQLSEDYIELESYMRTTVGDALQFINEHRYDPTEIYGEDMYEEFKNIPDPTIEPTYIFNQFIYVLDQLGPYAADKAAFSLLTKLEKLKIKVPYERHFLLLCLCTSVFVKIRCYSDIIFSKHESDWEKIRLFCTPKVLRFAEILEKFHPPEQSQNKNNTDTNTIGTNTKDTKISDMLKEIDKCDFLSLSNKIEDKVNAYEANLKDLDTNISDTNISDKNISDTNENNKTENKINSGNEVNNIIENFDNNSANTDNNTEKSAEIKPMDVVNYRGFGFPRRTGQRARGRGRMMRNNASRIQQNQQSADALCGIVFMKEPLMAKIMFMLIVDMSRGNPKLSYLCAQYCAVENPADPGTEPRECQRQGKKQEDVLKKFRMHECNLLLATSALEEGIDLPRCNLVLRWDVPASYRSYGLCRSRARAPRASCAVLSRGEGCTDTLLHNVAIYTELDQIISRKCGCGIQNEPPQSEEDHADSFTPIVKSYSPIDITKHNSLKVDKCKETELIKDSDPENEINKDEKIEIEVIENSDHKDNSNIIPNTKSTSKENKIEEIEIIRNENIENCDHTDNSKITPNNKSTNIENKIEETEIIKENSVNNVNVNINNDESLENINNKSCDTTNLLCNKCNKQRNSVDVECPCVSVKNINNNSERDSMSDKKCDGDIASVDLNTAIALINRYCGKLPSDTFTRLAPQWWMERVDLPVRGSPNTRPAYICTLRLPLNCPLKYNIVGHPMPSRVLARRMVALQACRILHKSGELDDQLMPIGKENFKAAELENTHASLNNGDLHDHNDSARPGTTKRRQYYYKRTAWAFTDCQPVVDTSDTEIENPGAKTPDIKHSSDEHSSENNGDAAKTENKGTKRNMLYAIVSKLWCALPERYNTRGRRLHAPQHASQAIGVLMARDEPDNLQIPAFPVYTRSGEVRVSVEHVPDADVRVSPRRGRLVRRFMRFVFAEVLRVRRRGMRLQSDGSTHNNYYIVPTIKTTKEDGTTKIDIDWQFLELIYQHTEEKKLSDIEKPVIWNHEEDGAMENAAEQTEKETVKKMTNPLLREGEVFVFDAEKYREAVVTPWYRNQDQPQVSYTCVKRYLMAVLHPMTNPLLREGEVFVFDADKYRETVITPWYRNQDQPQFFLVAEICSNLTPDSAFPSATHSSFRDYYTNKYGVTLTQSNQPLLDVDHTSARLNLLTPRYVNRKGVALPVSSERTRRAKRDRLDQKQILVPELCRVHPFAAPLWFATVALPCVLYRINALLIADEIRRSVAIDVGLGIPKIDEKTMPGFQWPPLHFGWSLAEVLNADSEKNEKKKEEEETIKKAEEEAVIEKAIESDEEPKTLNEILQKEVTDNAFEIGTWSNEMASSIPQSDYDEYMEPLPSNLTFCTSASGGANWCDPVEKPKSQFNPTRAYSIAHSDCSYMSSDFDTDDSDFNTEGSDDDTDTSGFCSGYSNVAMGVRIEYKTAHEAEAVDLERKKKTKPAPQPDEEDDALDRRIHDEFIRSGTAPSQYIEKFHESVAVHKEEIVKKGHLIKQDEPIVDILPESHTKLARTDKDLDPKLDRKQNLINEIFPYGTEEIKYENDQITLESIEKNKRVLLNELKKSLSMEEVKKLNCFSMVDVDIDSPSYVNEKVVNVGFDTKDSYREKIGGCDSKEFKPYYEESKGDVEEFDFDYQPTLEGHPGPSPSVILQALTMSNANDGINLERLETIGDSFLKFAITAYLYCAHPTVHEGKLSHMRSKQVSNLNLYRLGRNKRLGARMIASKFEPHDNWLPPCHKPPSTLHPRMAETAEQALMQEPPPDTTGCFIPYNLITQHSIPDKSIADCVEALIGAYLLECGPRGALLFMSWLGIRVLPRHDLPLPDEHVYVRAEHKPQPPPSPAPKRQRCDSESSSESSDDGDTPWRQHSSPEADWSWPGRPVGSLRPYRDASGQWLQPIFGELKAPPSPLLRYIEDPEGELDRMLSGYDALERTLQYRFKDRSLLLQALTHASHLQNKLTDCYQRLEFLGDAILDYLITRHLYEDPRRHSPGALTDLRSALVNNTIFATLAARHSFHKYFRHMSPGLNEVLTRYVKIQEENGHSISEEHYLIQEDEMEQAEDVEVPKALGDLFESVAGAIFLDSGMSLGAVWKSYLNLMGAELEAFSAAAPKSPVRELLEAEPDTAKFGKPERLADGRRVRVCVEVFGRGAFKGVGRNYRIAKGTAARCALRHLRVHRR